MRHVIAAVTLVIAVIATTVGLTPGTASADAPQGPYGLANIGTATDSSEPMFTHPWNGGWQTNVGLAWCIDTGTWDPRATNNAEIGDVPAERGVPYTDRLALSYAMWEFGNTTDNVTAAALSIVVRALSGDNHANPNIEAMYISNPTVKARAIEIANIARSRLSWADGPWQTNVALNFVGGVSGRQWNGTATFQNVNGTPIVGAEVWIRADGVTSSPGVGFPYITDANGQVHLTYDQAPAAPGIEVRTEALAPAYYRVWQGPPYASGPQAQRIVTPTEALYTARAQGDIPQGFGRVRKTTTNPNYQTAEGVTFDVRPVGGGASLGTLTVGATGTSNTLSLDPGTYEAVETSVPAGLVLDPTPHVFTVVQGQTTTLDLDNDVRREARLDLIKLDADTGEPLAGAIIRVARDSDNNGTYDEDLGTHTTTTTPLSLEGLTAGNYEITEIAAPPGYLISPTPTQYVTLQWNSTTEVIFQNWITPTISTYSQANGDDSTDGDITVPYGTRFHDVAVVTGLAANERATIEVTLYGPFETRNEFVCDDGTVFGTGSYVITGSGHHPSPTFTVTSPGIYTFIETLVTEDRGEYSGGCGDAGESVEVETPAITTVAQAPDAGPGSPVADRVIITGLANDVEATITTTLYGPFATPEAIGAACAAGDLGPAVGSVTDTFTGPGEHTSSTITLPNTGYIGSYTFIASMQVEGLDAITHACGDASETFAVAQRTHGDGDTSVKPTLPRTGSGIAMLSTAGLLLLGLGSAVVVTTRRRSEEP